MFTRKHLRLASSSTPHSLLLTVLAPALLSAGCAALQGPGAAYVAADRATYDALAPEFTAYVTHDPALTDDDRDRRLHALQSWQTRLTTAEASIAASPPSAQPSTAPND